VNDIITVRASSISDLFDCAYRFEGRQILGMRSPASRAMVLGTAVHAGTALFDQARMEGNPIKPDEAAGAVVDKLRDPGEDVRADENDMSPKDAEIIGLTLHTKYCTEISPRYEFRAVELDLGGLDIDVPDQGVTVRITGHLDRSRTSILPGAHALRISDLKTGARAATKDGKADVRGKALQLGLYQILAEMALNTPVDPVGEIIGLGTSKSTPIGVSEIASPKQQILGRGDGSPSLIEIAANMMKTGYFPPNPRSMTCGPKFCPRWNSCAYHE